jgi:hypothetical protein
MFICSQTDQVLYQFNVDAYIFFRVTRTIPISFAEKANALKFIPIQLFSLEEQKFEKILKCYWALARVRMNVK